MILPQLLRETLLLWVGLLSVVGFASMGIDKARAVGGSWRVPEKSLFVVAFAGGAFGSLFGMIAFSHKTRKPGFVAIVGFAALTWLVILFASGLFSPR